MRIPGLQRRSAKSVGDQRLSEERPRVDSAMLNMPAAALVMLSAFVITLGALVIPNVIAIVKG